MRRIVTARDLMKRPVRQLTAWTPVKDAAAFLLRHGISGAPVIDDHGKWRGVFTLNDLARGVQSRMLAGMPERTLESREAVDLVFATLPQELGMAKVGDLMTPGLYTVFADATLEEVVHTLTSFKVHRVFVIEEQGSELLGVITTMDLLRWMDQHPAESRLHAGRA